MVILSDILIPTGHHEVTLNVILIPTGHHEVTLNVILNPTGHHVKMCQKQPKNRKVISFGVLY